MESATCPTKNPSPGERFEDLAGRFNIDLQDFTPEEQECISRKISALREEGMEQDQAIAVAIKHCAPGKSQADKSSTGKDAAKMKYVVGGAYRAIDHGDGTFDILDVPIFAEVESGEKHNERKINRAWQLAAWKKNEERSSEGHLPPVHVEHHEAGKDREFAGHFLIRDVRQIAYEGRQIWATFADLISVPASIFERIQRGELPYRSVEVHSWENPEIDSLALMASEVPYFRLPMLRVGEVVRAEADERLPADSAPALAFAASAEMSRILFRFRNEVKPMPDSTEKLADDEKDEKDEDEKEEKPEKMEDDSAGAMAEILNLLKAIAAQMGIMQPAMQEQPPVAPMGPGGPVEQNLSADALEVAKLTARLDSVEAKTREREAKEKIVGLAAKAKESLKGWNLTATMISSIEKFAAQGRELLDSYVSTIKESVAPEPPNTFAEFESGGAPSDPEEVLKYASKGKDALIQARELSKNYSEYVKSTKSDLSLGEFLETQFKLLARRQAAESGR